jgi:hypothetical protein
MHRNGLIRTVEGGEDGNAGAGSAGESGNKGEAQATQFEPIASQEQLDKLIADRLTRERSKYADYKDLKSKAKAYDELEDAKKTEAQRNAERLAQIERERDEATATALRLRIAAKHGIAEEDADLFLTGTDEETLTRQAKRLAEREGERRKNGNTVPAAGSRPRPGNTDEEEERESVRSLFAQQ